MSVLYPLNHKFTASYRACKHITNRCYAVIHNFEASTCRPFDRLRTGSFVSQNPDFPTLFSSKFFDTFNHQLFCAHATNLSSKSLHKIEEIDHFRIYRRVLNYRHAVSERRGRRARRDDFVRR